MSVEVGQQVKGRVVSIKNFGAFISLPDNTSGMVHISEVSDGFVKDINDYISVGDEVNVKVIKLTDDGKINLSLRSAEGNDLKKPEEKSHSKEKDDSRRDNKQNHGSKPKYQDKKQGKPAYSSKQNASSGNDFDSMMNNFLKDSEDRLSSIRRNTEGKRGGRGGRRN